jgi:hypothetical protein
MFLLEKFAGRDISRMWRWPRTNPVSLDTRHSYEIYPRR